MIPLPVILVEFMAAFGLALFTAYAAALVRLRREGPEPAREGGRTPSRGRLMAGLAVGFVVTTWAVATFVAEGYTL